MTRTTRFIAILAASLALPAAASAHCGTTQGSFAVTCENGVQVYRHNAPSAIPQGLSVAQAQLEAAKLRAKTAQSQINANARAQSRKADQKDRALAIEDYRARIYDRNTRGRNIGYAGGYGLPGYGFARPIVINSGSGINNRDRNTRDQNRRAAAPLTQPMPARINTARKSPANSLNATRRAAAPKSVRKH